MCKIITIEGNGLDLYSYDMISYFTRLLLTLIKLKSRKKKVHFSQLSLALLYVFPYNISPLDFVLNIPKIIGIRIE